MTLQDIVSQAQALHNAGALDQAEPLYARAAAQLPGHADLLFNHALVLHALDRNAEALERFDQVLAIRRDDAAAWNGKGAALGRMARPQEAIDAFQQALALRPQDAGAWFNLGMAFVQLQRFEDALPALDRAVSIQPDRAATWHERGASLRALGRFDDALASFDRAAQIDGTSAAVAVSQGLVLIDLERYVDALAAFDRALALAADLPEALNNRGLVLQYLGRRDQARGAYAGAIDSDAAMAAAYLNYAGTVEFTAADDPRLVAMQAARDAEGLSPSDQARLDFALAKAYGDLDQIERSFSHLERGNRLQRASMPYDEASELGHFRAVAEVFTASTVERLIGLHGGRPSTDVIFVVGMPRSGTTLIEQILASHPDIHGAGEITALHDAIRLVLAQRDLPPYPHGASALDAAGLSEIAERYRALARANVPSGVAVVDKLPSNFFNLGMIAAALPGARIVHCVRDPLDTSFSRFAKLFLDKNAYAYDQGELGRYHRAYDGLMDHWRKVLPPGVLLDVRYEDVVEDLAGQTRRLLEFYGLPYDRRCLAFNETARPVRTPSALQVRQPLYSTAVGRSRAYEPYLGPLKAALGLGAGDA